MTQEVYGRGGYMEWTPAPMFKYSDDPDPIEQGMRSLVPPMLLAQDEPAKPGEKKADPVVDINVLFQEGPQYFVNRITFTGNTTTRDNVIRREKRLVEGTEGSSLAWKDSVRRLEGNPLRILDSKNPEMRDVIANAPVLSECFDPESKQHFDGLRRLPGTLVQVVLQRGLAYAVLTSELFLRDPAGPKLAHNSLPEILLLRRHRARQHSRPKPSAQGRPWLDGYVRTSEQRPRVPLPDPHAGENPEFTRHANVALQFRPSPRRPRAGV